MLKRALYWLHAFEDALLALLLTGMIGLACTQIVMRNFFDAGISWGDPALRIAVLWISLMGALAASRGDQHIRIDLLSRFLRGRMLAASQVLTSLFTSAVGGLLAWHCGRFVWEERQYETTVFNDLPAWWFESILPIAFGFMALRYLLLAGLHMIELIKAAADEAAEPEVPQT